MKVLDHGSFELLNISSTFDREVKDVDPALVARMSMDDFNGERAEKLDLKLVKYLMSAGHNTPIEMTEVWMRFKLPIFVARQFMRSRTATFNECSGRYVQLPAKWYVPDIENIGFSAESIKQGRDMDRSMDKNDIQLRELFRLELNDLCQQSYLSYEYYIEKGIPNELARCFLHVNHYTDYVCKVDLHNLMFFLKKRLANDTQFESRQYAKAILAALTDKLPQTMNIFDHLQWEAEESKRHIAKLIKNNPTLAWKMK